MDIFVLNHEVARLEAEILPLSGDLLIAKLIQLSWHLRQRDTDRALELADRVKTMLPTSHLSALEQKTITARLQLIDGEAKWLFADLLQATHLAHGALNSFSELGDECGIADARWLLAWIAIDSGNLNESDAQFEASEQAAQKAGDELRRRIAETALARWDALRNPINAKEHWLSHFDNNGENLPVALAVWRQDFLGMIHHFTGDLGLAIKHTKASYELALATGQLRVAIISANNASEDFNRLNDHQLALEWSQEALAIARPTKWPRSIGACLMHMAENQRYIGNLDAAQNLITEALDVLTPVANSRPYFIALQYQGNLALDKKDYATALSTFWLLEKKSADLQQSDFYIDSQRGQAHALSHLDQPDAAITAGHAALSAAQEKGDSARQIDALTVIADILSRHSGTLSGSDSGRTAMHYLLQIKEIASTIAGYTASSKYLESLSHEYARTGQFEQAYRISQQAIEAREKTHSNETTKHAMAMQVAHQTERAHSESLRHQHLAELEAQRSEVLLKTSSTLQQLSTIGREITTHLDTASIFHVLDKHMHGLMDVQSFAIYLLEPEAKRLKMAFSIEEGKSLPIAFVELSDLKSNAVRCLREHQQILCDLAGEDNSTIIPNTLCTRTALFAPLTIGERQIGVMTVQSMERHAYDDHDRLIFGTLSAYAAIAINNAQTYLELQATQKRLLAQEKMAALGSLVAGVSHELNTPISNSILLASTMSHKTEILYAKFTDNQMRKSDLVHYLDESKDAFDLNLRSLQSAAELVESFKQIAVDRTTAQRRIFNVGQLARDIATTMMNQLQKINVSISLEIADNIDMDSYPGPLGQVIMNFINNALRHAFEQRHDGQIILSARQTDGDRIQIQFSDNGNGIPAENLLKIFDPFFTTKLGQGGSGLGLSISYNIVTSILNGQISVQSEPRNGATFTLDLPRVAPN